MSKPTRQRSANAASSKLQLGGLNVALPPLNAGAKKKPA